MLITYVPNAQMGMLIHIVIGLGSTFNVDITPLMDTLRMWCAPENHSDSKYLAWPMGMDTTAHALLDLVMFDDYDSLLRLAADAYDEGYWGMAELYQHYATGVRVRDSENVK